MRLARFLLIAAIIALLWPMRTEPVLAQAPVGIQILGTVTTPGQESLGLDVYFVAVDSAGKPIKRPDINSASIQVIGGSQAPATVGDPNSDINIVMLMDTSGSMTNVIDSVREAALSSLESMPPNARVSVVSFNERATTMTDFTNDLQGVADAIGRVRVEQAGTCLYDSVWNAIDQLAQVTQRPQDRRAIILFTDGRDQRSAASNDPCSIHTYRDMVNKALSSPTTPLHTIGLCSGSCGNLNVDEMQEMAQITGGFSALGDETNLSTMFREIMEGLNSQQAARANVYARQGENQGVLTLLSRDGVEVSSAPFVFVSDRDYTAPPPAPDVRVPGLTYDPEANTYRLALAIANSQQVGQLVLSLEETDGGKTVFSEELNPQGRETLETDFSAASLTPGENYTVFIRAVDPDGFMIERPDTGGFNDNDRTILTSKEFTHEPPVVNGVPFGIRSVNPDFTTKSLMVTLDLPETLPSRLIYQGFILDADTGSEIQTIPQALLESRQVAVSMAPVIADLEAPKELRLALTLETTGDEPQQTSQEFDFKIVPPKKPSIFVRAADALQQNPIFVVLIIAFVALFFGFRYMQSRRVASQMAEIRRPPVNKTSTIQPVMPQQVPGGGTPRPRLRLRILRTTGGEAGREMIVESFPFVIGRKEGNLVLAEDTRMSRKHASIVARNGQLVIEDLKSTNHTYVNGRQLQPGESALLTGVTTIRFGPDTEIQVEPYPV
ncbi:MAG: VWA domain-containing protein [Anaerolineae bacterium]|nr:VWA domain-containing protein [Anaerolineae bacterium]